MPCRVQKEGGAIMRMPVSFSADSHTFQIWVEMKKHGNRSQIMRALLHGWASIHEKELSHMKSGHIQPAQVWVVEGMDAPRCNPHLKMGRCPKCWPIEEHYKLKQNREGRWIYGGVE